MEAVTGILVNEQRKARVRSLDFRDLFLGDTGILLAEMQHGGAARSFVLEVVDLTAVVAGSGSRLHSGSRQPGKGTAPAVADDADLARSLDRIHGGGDVLQGILPRYLAADFPAGRHIGLIVAQLHTLLDPVEQSRRDRQIALGGKTVGHGADVAVGAEDFLDDDQPAARLSGRLGLVGVERMAVGGLERDGLAHVDVLPE